MTRRFSVLASVVAPLVLLPALTGCVFHKNSPPPVVAIAPQPEPTYAPLYSSELNPSVPTLPYLPAAPPPDAQPAPPAQPAIQTAKKHPGRRSRERKGDETEVAQRETPSRETLSRETTAREAAREAHEKETASAAAGEPNGSDGTTPAREQSVAKVTTQTPTGDTAQPTAIGELTAGPTQDTAASRRQAVELIQDTQRGVNGLHRNLSGDESKTVAQIRSFLQQAQRALHNGDIDGANTLATKAKVLLTELTGNG